MPSAPSPRPTRGSVSAAKHPRPCHYCHQAAIAQVRIEVGNRAIHAGVCREHYREHLIADGWRWPAQEA